MQVSGIVIKFENSVILNFIFHQDSFSIEVFLFLF